MTHPATFRFQVGDAECMAVLDGTLRYPPALFFANLPRETYEARLAPPGQALETIEVPYLFLYIDTGKDRVLVDTGAAGFGPTTGLLQAHLGAAGIDPASIGTVVLTHGHPDHIGGNLSGDGTPAFPNAVHVMFRREWDYWRSGPTLAEMPADQWLKDICLMTARRNLPPIEPQLRLLDQPGRIVPGVTALAAPGHTVGHMALEIESAGQRMLFLADTIVHLLDAEHPDTRAVFDHHPGEMIETRRRLLHQAAADRTLAMGSHLPFPGLGYLTPSGTAWVWDAI